MPYGYIEAVHMVKDRSVTLQGKLVGVASVAIAWAIFRPELLSLKDSGVR